MTLETLGSLFEADSIPLELWDHKTHVLVAVYALVRYPAADALSAVRSGIHRLNARYGKTAYHETITVFWMAVLAGRLVRETPPITATCDDVYERTAKGLDEDFIARYYSPERLHTQAARASFVPPDLHPLP